jgi:uncharacterized protein YdiU (UPF0061 family)
MITIPQASPYRPDPQILEVADFLGDPVSAADFPSHHLRFRNQRWGAAVGLDALSDAAWLSHFGTFHPLEDNLTKPLALRYHGHQFRVYNPDIGDGRGFLFAQMRDGGDRLLDLGTKGSGQTPYSRFGDGRLTLKGGIREVLATEMLEALGVETSKTFSLVETGEALDRNDEPSPTRSSVLVRLSHGHLRIGSFQRLATLKDEVGLKRLVDYGLKTYFNEEPGEQAAERLLDIVSMRTARLAASYMAAGFVHGVLNSDNINITGESFDYGPWRFTPTWQPGFTAAYFDHQGLYCFARQAQAIHWDLAQLAIALTLLAEQDALMPPLEAFPDRFEAALMQAMLDRLDVAPRSKGEDLQLVNALQRSLETSQCSIDRFFFDWRGGELRKAAQDYDGPEFVEFKTEVKKYSPLNDLKHPYWYGEHPCSMHIEEVEAIWKAIADYDDWSVFNAKVVAIRAMGAAMRGEPD